MNDLNEKGEFKLEKEELKKIHSDFSSESLSEEETILIINEIYKNEKILVDPHTAVGIGVMKKISLGGNTVILATAHPSKFSEIVMKATNTKPELPENLKNISSKKEKYEKLPKDIKIIQNYILKRV
jgi:threonine synthase